MLSNDKEVEELTSSSTQEDLMVFIAVIQYLIISFLFISAHSQFSLSSAMTQLSVFVLCSIFFPKY